MLRVGFLVLQKAAQADPHRSMGFALPLPTGAAAQMESAGTIVWDTGDRIDSA